MTYVDGFLMPVPKAKLAAYRRFATLGKKAWMEHGALDYKECVADDLFSMFPDEKGRAQKVPSLFPKMALARRGEVVVFSFIVFRSKAHRDRVNKDVMADPRMTSMDPAAMPVDMKRFGYAGFKVLVDAGASGSRRAGRPARRTGSGGGKRTRAQERRLERLPLSGRTF